MEQIILPRKKYIFHVVFFFIKRCVSSLNNLFFSPKFVSPLGAPLKKQYANQRKNEPYDLSKRTSRLSLHIDGGKCNII